MEHFIQSVRNYPCLWNTTAIEYRDQELKDAAWAEVMKETDLCSVKEVKLKWKKLRDSYRDALKRQGEMLARDPPHPPTNKKPYPWKYMGLMQFLQPHMNARKRAEPPRPEPPELHEPPERDEPRANGHAARASPPSSSSSDSEPSPPSPPTHAPAPARRRALAHIDRKLSYLCKRRRSASPPAPAAPAPAPAHPDPLDIFFNSMCQASKRLPFVTQIKIKRTLFEAVTAGEEALLLQHEQASALWVGGAGGPASSSSEPDEPAGPV